MNKRMYISKKEWPDLVKDLGKLDYIPGDLSKTYKYKVVIPANIWNKWRSNDPVRDKRTVKFGRPGYQQYYDRIGEWKSVDHFDQQRLINYRARHEAIMKGIGDKKYPSYQVPFTNEFFSWYLLW